MQSELIGNNLRGRQACYKLTSGKEIGCKAKRVLRINKRAKLPKWVEILCHACPRCSHLFYRRRRCFGCVYLLCAHLPAEWHPSPHHFKQYIHPLIYWSSKGVVAYHFTSRLHLSSALNFNDGYRRVEEIVLILLTCCSLEMHNEQLEKQTP